MTRPTLVFLKPFLPFELCENQDFSIFWGVNIKVFFGFKSLLVLTLGLVSYSIKTIY